MEKDTDIFKNVVLHHDFGKFRLYYFNYPVTFTEVLEEAKREDYIIGRGALKQFIGVSGNMDEFSHLSSKKMLLISVKESKDALYNFQGDDIFVKAEIYDGLEMEEIKVFLTKKQKYNAWFIAWRKESFS